MFVRIHMHGRALSAMKSLSVEEASLLFNGEPRDEGVGTVTELLAWINLSWQFQPYSIYKAQLSSNSHFTSQHN